MRCNYSILVTLNEIGGVSFHLNSTSGFHVKVENEIYRCLLAFLSEPQVRKFHVVVWQASSTIAAKSVLHVRHDYFSSFNQSVISFICGVGNAVASSLLKLHNNRSGTRQARTKRFFFSNLVYPVRRLGSCNFYTTIRQFPYKVFRYRRLFITEIN